MYYICVRRIILEVDSCILNWTAVGLMSRQEVLNFFKETGMVVLSGTILGRNRNKFLENVDLTSSILHIWHVNNILLVEKSENTSCRSSIRFFFLILFLVWLPLDRLNSTVKRIKVNRFLNRASRHKTISFSNERVWNDRFIKSMNVILKTADQSKR